MNLNVLTIVETQKNEQRYSFTCKTKSDIGSLNAERLFNFILIYSIYIAIVYLRTFNVVKLSKEDQLKKGKRIPFVNVPSNLFRQNNI